MFKFLSTENQYFTNVEIIGTSSDFKITNLFSSLNALIIFSSESQTIDFQNKINFKHALTSQNLAYLRST